MPLLEKLKQMEAEKNANSEAVKQRVQAWKSAIDRLFDRIESDFADLKKENLATFVRTDLRITEEATGSYGVKQLRMRVGGRDFIFEPAGLYVIGAAGRVDLYPHGLRNQGYMLLREGETDKWIVAAMEIQQRKYEPLDRQVLERIIENFIETYSNVSRA